MAWLMGAASAPCLPADLPPLISYIAISARLRTACHATVLPVLLLLLLLLRGAPGSVRYRTSSQFLRLGMILKAFGTCARHPQATAIRHTSIEWAGPKLTTLPATWN